MNNPLSQSVLNQKTGAKLWDNPGERSQGSAARRCREEARFRRPLGLRLGPDRGRASPPLAKSVCSASYRSTTAAAPTVRGMQSVRVAHAITPDNWFCNLTG